MTETRIRTAAVLNADIVGYSRHVADDPGFAADSVRELTAIATAEVAAAGGTLVDFVGDNFMAVFDTSEAAVRGAIGVCTATRARNGALPPERRMRFRMGLDRGDVLMGDGASVVGDAVNVAARIQTLAPAGGITVSERVYLDLDEPELRFVPLGDQRFKNIAGRTAAYRLDGVVPPNEGAEPLPIRRRRASIAVLPSIIRGASDATEAALAALRLDLVTALVGMPDLDVVDSPTAEVTREVDYTVESSILVVGEVARVYTHVFEWRTVNKVWARRWDVAVADILAASDRISGEVVRAVEVDLVVGEPARIYRAEMDGRGLDSIYRGWADFMQDTPESWWSATQRFEQVARDNTASSIGPGLAAFIHWYGLVSGFATDPMAHVQKALTFAEQGLTLGDEAGLSRMVKAGMALVDGSDLDDALETARASVTLRPTCDATFAVEAAIHRFRGSWEEGVVAGRRCLELSKGNRPLFAVGLAGNLWVGGRYREAAEVASIANEGRQANPELLLIEAASYQLLGMERRARAVMEAFLADHPQTTMEELRMRHPYRDPVVADRWFGALQDAGLPDGAPVPKLG